MRVRDARYEDAQAMGIVHVDTWRSTYRGIVPDAYLDSLSHESSGAKWRQRLMSRELGRLHLVAEADDGRIVGIAEAGLNEDQKFPSYEAQIYTLYILKDYQHMGIGRMFMRAVAERLIEMGIEDLLVWVISRNPSRGFYARMGGRLLGASTFNIHGQDIEESAYGWDDLSVLLRSGARDQREHLLIR